MTQLGERRCLKCFGICFLSFWPFNPEPTKVWIWSPRQVLLCHYSVDKWFSSVFLSLAVNRVRSSKFTAVTSLGEELMRLSSLGVGDFILGGLKTLKICHKPSYEWAVVAKTVHQLKFLHLPKFNDRSPTMARVIAIYQKHMTT